MVKQYKFINLFTIDINFHHFHEIRICYVYNGHSDTCDLRFKNCLGFIVFLAENRAAARGFDRHCLQNSFENQKIASGHEIMMFVCLFCR